MLELKHGLKLDKTRDEKARMNFVSGLRAHVLNDMASGMRAVWDADVEPAFRRSRGRLPKDGPEVHAAMKPNEYFKFYSSLRVTAQDMVWQAVFPPLERNRAALKDKAARLGRASKARGTLSLKPGFEVPRSVSAIDVHLMAGNYDGEYEDGDLAAGSLYDNGLAVFSFGLMGQNLDDIGQSIAGFIKLKFPQLKPRKILDLGCTIGHNTGSWKDQFPAAEVHGIDVAAPCLRYAHARAGAGPRAALPPDGRHRARFPGRELRCRLLLDVPPRSAAQGHREDHGRGAPRPEAGRSHVAHGAAAELAAVAV